MITKEDQRRASIAKKVINDALKRINNDLATGEFVLNTSYDTFHKNSYYGKAFHDWELMCDINGDDVDFLKSSGLDDLQLSSFEILSLNPQGFLPIELFYCKNKDVLSPQVWLKVYYNQLILRNDDVVKDIISDFCLKVTQENALEFVGTLSQVSNSVKSMDRQKIRFLQHMYSTMLGKSTTRSVRLKHQIIKKLPETVKSRLDVQVASAVLVGTKFKVSDETYSVITAVNKLIDASMVDLKERAFTIHKSTPDVIVEASLKSRLKLLYVFPHSPHFKHLKNSEFNYDVFTELVTFEVKNRLGLI